MPWLDHGIHSVTLLTIVTVTEWIAGVILGFNPRTQRDNHDKF
jgi:hypothetical protein